VLAEIQLFQQCLTTGTTPNPSTMDDWRFLLVTLSIPDHTMGFFVDPT